MLTLQADGNTMSFSNLIPHPECPYAEGCRPKLKASILTAKP